MRSILLDGRPIVPGKIVCVGKNYPDHVQEMGGGGLPAEPAIFLKPNSAIAEAGEAIAIPEALGLLHHEVELCFVVGREGKAIGEGAAGQFIAGWGVGIDFTLRDRQAAEKRTGGSWNLAKGFDNAAAFGAFVGARAAVDVADAAITLAINGEVRQHSRTCEMIFSPAKILSFVSRFMTIEAGDVFMTGTPAGVGEVKHGDVLRAEIEGLPALTITVLRH